MPFTHAIITFTKSHILISNSENEALRKLPLDGWFEAQSGERIKAFSIAEILPIHKYYTQYPEKAETQGSLPEWKTPRDEYVSELERGNRDKIRGKQMLEGLLKFCKENPDAKAAREEYSKRLKIYKTTFGIS